MANRPEDIMSGNYSLQGVRNSDIYSGNSRGGTPFTDEEIQERIANFSRQAELNNWNSRSGRVGRGSLYSGSFLTPTNMPVGSEGEDYGISRRFDRGILNAHTGDEIVNQRAENQSGFEQFINGVSKGSILAGTTFLDGTLGLAFGLVDAGQAAASGDKDWYARIWDNSVSNGLQQINQLSEEVLPNYRTVEEQNRNWLGNVFTVNFLADTFLKNMGFTVGAIYSGRTFNSLLKTSGLGAMIAGGLYSAVNEARVEANNNSDDWEKLQLQKLNDQFDIEAQNLYNTAATQEEFDRGIAYLNQRREEALQKIGDDKNKVGALDLLANIPLLTVNDILTWGRIYAKGFESAKEAAARAGKQVTKEARQAAADHAILAEAGKKITDRIEKQAGRYGWNDIKKSTAILNSLRSAVREGNEELSQAMAAEFAGQLYLPDSPESYYRASTDTSAKDTTNNIFSTLVKSFEDTYGDWSRYEEFAVGALTGLLGVPTFGRNMNADASTGLGRNKPIGLSGGLLGELSERRVLNEQGRAAVADMNAFLDKFESDIENFARRTSFSNAMDGYVLEDNKFEYKNAEDNDMFEQISQFARMGKIGDLKDIVQAAFNELTDTQLETIAAGVSNTDTSDDGTQLMKKTDWRGDDGKLLSETEEGRAKMREELAARGRTFAEDIQNFEDSFDLVRRLGNNAVDDGVATELAWLNWKTKKFAQRFDSLRKDESEDLQKLSQILRQIKSIEAKRLEEARADLTKLGDSEEDKERRKRLDADIASMESYAKDYNNVLQLVDDLTNATDVDDFTRLVGLRGKEYADGVFTSLLNLDKDDVFTTLPGYNTMIDSIQDLMLLSSANKQFHKAFKEYSEDPAKFRQMHGKIDAERQQEVKQKENKKKTNTVKQQTVGDLSDLPLEDLEDLLNNTVEGSEANEKVKAAQEFKEYKEAFDDEIARSISEAQSEGALNPDDEAAIFGILDRLKAESNSVQEYIDKLGNVTEEDIPVTQEEIEAYMEANPTTPEEEALNRIAGQKADEVNRMMSAAMEKLENGKRERESFTPSERKTQAKDKALTKDQKNVVKRLAADMVKEATSAASLGVSTDNLIADAEDLLLEAYDLKKNSNDSDRSLVAQLRKDDTFKMFDRAGAEPSLYILDLFESDVMFPKEGKPAESPASPAEVPIGTSSGQAAAAYAQPVSPAETEPEKRSSVLKAGEFVSSTPEIGNVKGERYSFDASGRPIPYYRTEAARSVYTEEQIAEMGARQAYLTSVGAFERRYSPNFAPETKVHFEIRKEANDAISTDGKSRIMILIVNDAGEIVGDMPASWSRSNKENVDWIKAQEEAFKVWAETHPNETYVLQGKKGRLETTVAETWKGNVAYTDTPLPLSEVFAGTNPRISVVTDIKENVNGSTAVVIGDTTVAVSSPGGIKAKGTPVVLLPSGNTVTTPSGIKKVQYYAVPVSQYNSRYVNTVKFEARNPGGVRVVLTAAKNRLEAAIRQAAQNSGSIFSTERETTAVPKLSKSDYTDFGVLFNTFFHIPEEKKGGIPTLKDNKLTFTFGDYTFQKSVFDADFVDYILDQLEALDLYVQVAGQKCNTTIHLFGEDFDYNKLIMPIFRVNLPVGTTRTVDAGFRLKPFSLTDTVSRTEEQKEKVRENVQRAAQKPESIPDISGIAATTSKSELAEAVKTKLNTSERRFFENKVLPEISLEELTLFASDITGLKRLYQNARSSTGTALKSQINRALEGIRRVRAARAVQTAPESAEISTVPAEELATRKWEDLPQKTKDYLEANRSNESEAWDQLDYNARLEHLRC